MSGQADLMARVDQYIEERRRHGFILRTTDHRLRSFAKYATGSIHDGPLTIELMADWARQVGDRATAARRLKLLRPFMRWMQQFEPRTQVPDESVFGPIPGRTAPHIYRESEIIDLLAAARQLRPRGLRPAIYETLFGLLASTGLRISEALALCDGDVDLQAGMLTIRQTKFTKSRLVALHPTVVQALARYQRKRCREMPGATCEAFFVTIRGKRRGQRLHSRTVNRVFDDLREQLAWTDRGTHGGPRIHDLRHTFAVRRLILWYQQGVDVDQRMLALSTYLGHAKISNTYWYLTGVPELVALAGARFETYAEALGADHE